MASSGVSEEVNSSSLNRSSVDILFVVTLGLTIVLLTKSQMSRRSGGKATASPEADFRRFQSQYLLVYLLMTAGDWLQGPYMYALYDAYGYSHQEIAALFVAGFGSSCIFGTFVGSFADSFGRKRGALLYVVTYALSCVTKHWKDYTILMLGRVLGGVSTSLLFSVFEAWLVSEHAKRRIDSSLLSIIFANAQAANSFVAIAAGVLGEWSANLYPLTEASWPATGFVFGGYTAPFDLAALFLCIGGIVIAATWDENYGETSRAASASSATAAFRTGARLIFSDTKILVVGLVSAAFEASMYAFVFEWTPALTSNDASAEKPPYGEIFAIMMLCCMCGTRVFGAAQRLASPDKTLLVLILASAAALLVPSAVAGVRPLSCLFAFLLFEVCVGVYFPAISTLKSALIPDTHRATIYNLFRVPLNVLVLAILLSRFTSQTVFISSVALLLTAALLQRQLCARLAAVENEDDEKRTQLLRYDQDDDDKAAPATADAAV